MMKAIKPFEFQTSSQLVEIMNKKAEDLKSLAGDLKHAEDSVVFYHVHHAFREYKFAPGAYANDFAHWVAEELGENALAEKLANINIMEYTEISALRDRIVGIIEAHVKANPDSAAVKAKHKFYFCKNIGIVQKTKYTAWDLEEFCEMLKKVGLRSLFFHFFEARLRLHKRSNDFSDWIKHEFGNEALAKKIEAIDPYNHTMDNLRDRIIELISGKKTGFFEDIKQWLRIR